MKSTSGVPSTGRSYSTALQIILGMLRGSAEVTGGSVRKEEQMDHAKSILVLFIATMMFSPGCGQKATDEIDFGTVKNSTYRNEYFGLTVALPPDWSVQDQETRQRLLDFGSQAIAGDNKSLKAVLKASELATANLFAAFKHPLGAPVPYNPNILCVAERVRHMPGIKSGKDYLFHSRRILESSQMEVSFPIDVSTESLGGQNFGVMHTEMSMAGMAVRQKYYAAIMKGYALTFIVSFTTDEEESSLQSILKSVTFR